MSCMNINYSQQHTTHPVCGQLPCAFLANSNYRISDGNRRLGKYILNTRIMQLPSTWQTQRLLNVMSSSDH